MSFADLKRNKDTISKLLDAANASGGGEKKSYNDERIWKPTVDKAGNGYAVIRFLPTVEGDDLPWAKYWDHFFQGPTPQALRPEESSAQVPPLVYAESAV